MDFTFNKKCPICLEKNGDFFVLSCLHKIHLECCKNLNSMTCPLCRELVKNYPEVVTELIQKNIQNLRKENEQEDLRNIVQTYTNVYSDITNRPLTPQLEIILAIEYLRENNIPQLFIPEKVEITFFENQPVPQKGAIFSAIIDTVLTYIDTYENNQPDHNDEYSFETEESDSDDDDPFVVENAVLEGNGVNIRIRKIQST